MQAPNTKVFQWIVAPLSTAILLSAGWYKPFSGLLALIAFIPLLIAEHQVSEKVSKPQFKVFLLGLICFISWNLITTWWIKNASVAGFFAAVLVSSTLMAVSFYLFHITKKRLGPVVGYTSFVAYWLAYEFIYIHGEISWPWLTLGHSFAYEVKLIQWYDTTGVFGGSLWILLCNVFIFLIINPSRFDYARRKKYTLYTGTALLIVVPVLISFVKYNSYTEESNPVDIIVVQPNIDPYLKFVDMSALEQAQIQFDEARKILDSNVDYVVGPETSLLGNFRMGYFEQAQEVKIIRRMVDSFPHMRYLTGIWCTELYPPGEKPTQTASSYGNTGLYYDTHNSAIQIDTTPEIPIYHKSQLVTGIEKMPYAEHLRFLEKLMVGLGGTFRNHGIQEERGVFPSANDAIRVGPIICWESVFGEFVTGYTQKGANVLFVITNDGWWKDTPGHRQHNALSSIRAIENRRSIARSANTGISCFINQRGDVGQKLTWWKRGAIRDTINANEAITFYVKHGDYIGRTALWLTVAMLLFTIVRRLTGK